jgi:hypothetical protein
MTPPTLLALLAGLPGWRGGARGGGAAAAGGGGAAAAAAPYDVPARTYTYVLRTRIPNVPYVVVPRYSRTYGYIRIRYAAVVPSALPGTAVARR